MPWMWPRKGNSRTYDYMQKIKWTVIEKLKIARKFRRNMDILESKMD